MRGQDRSSLSALRLAVSGAVLAGAVVFAREVGVRRVRDLPVRAGAEALQVLGQQRARLARSARSLPGATAIVDAVDAAVRLPFDAGLAFERARFLHLLEAPSFQALRHVFFAERETGAGAGTDTDTDTPVPVRMTVATLGTAVAAGIAGVASAGWLATTTVGVF